MTDDSPALRRPAKTAAQLLPDILRNARWAVSREIQHLPGGGIYRAHVATTYAVFVAIGARGLALWLDPGRASSLLRRWADQIEAGVSDADEFFTP